MTNQNLNQKELLYNPKNWVFLTLIFGPILPMIFYYRNCKLLNKTKTGILALTLMSFYTIVIIPIIIFYTQSQNTILLILGITILIIISKLSKTQIPAYEKMKQEKGIKGGRNEAPMILLFITIWIIIITIFTINYINMHQHYPYNY